MTRRNLQRISTHPAARARPLLSVVVPVHNEEDCLPTLYRRIVACLDVDLDYEILFIDDGSRDRSLELIEEFAESNPRVGFTSLSRNFGHESASSCGLAQAVGDAVVLMDADLQHPPEVIPLLLERWREGFDVVQAIRSRREERLSVRWTSGMFTSLMRCIAGPVIEPGSSDFRLIDRRVVRALRAMPERRRWVRGLVAWTGFRRTTLTYESPSRLAGTTKYNFRKRWRLAWDAVCSLSSAPLEWIAPAGLALFVSTTLATFGATIAWSLGRASSTALALSGLYCIGGLLTWTAGLLAEYLSRVHEEVQNRPTTVTAKRRRPWSRRRTNLTDEFIRSSTRRRAA